MPLWLLNCTRCDDVQRIVERQRGCECDSVHAMLDIHGKPHLIGPGRILTIPWEAYDGAAPGDQRTWTVYSLSTSISHNPSR